MLKKIFLSVLLLYTSKLNAQVIKMVDSDNLFTSFKQGNRGDCVSIALIKAGICVFGINGIFSEKKLNDTITEVTLKNGKQYRVSNSEIKIADTAMHIKKRKNADAELINYSVKCFAIMSKVKQINEGRENFESAMNRLLKGAKGHKSFYLLGLENNCIILDSLPDYHSFCGGVAWTKKHVVFVCNGFMDKYGKKVPVSNEYYGGFKVIK